MSTSDAVVVAARLLGSRPQSCQFRYVSTRNFRGRRSFSARETVIDTATGITPIPTRVAAGLGREMPACQY